MHNVYRRTWQELGLKVRFSVASPFLWVGLQHIHTQSTSSNLGNERELKDINPDDRKDLSSHKPFSKDELLVESIERLSKERRDSRLRRKLSISAAKLSFIKESTERSHSSRLSVSSSPLQDLSRVSTEKGIFSFKDHILPLTSPSSWSAGEASDLRASAFGSTCEGLDASFCLEEMERMLFRSRPHHDAKEFLRGVGGNNNVQLTVDTLPALEDIKTGIPMPIKNEREESTQDVGAFLNDQVPLLPTPLSLKNTHTCSTEQSNHLMDDAQEVAPLLAQSGESFQYCPVRSTYQLNNAVRDASSQTADHEPLTDPFCSLLSLSHDPERRVFTIAPEAPIPTLWDALRGLNQALTQVESLSPAKGGDDTTAISIHLHLVRTQHHADGAPNTPLSLNPVYSELGASALHRLDVSSRKEELLERILSAADRGVRIMALVEPDAVILGFAAELFFCCEGVIFTGRKDSVRVGFPELMYGVFPAPAMIRIVAEYFKENGRLSLFSMGSTAGFLHDASSLPLGGNTSCSIFTNAAVNFLPYLHTKPFSHWEAAVLHGWCDITRKSIVIANPWIFQGWRFLSYYTQLVSQAFSSFLMRMRPGTVHRLSLSRRMMLVEVRHSIRLQWQCYCCAIFDDAKGNRSTRFSNSDLREVIMACLNSIAVYNSHKLYQYVMNNLLPTQGTRSCVSETGFVYLDDQSLPNPESAEATAYRITNTQKHRCAKSAFAPPIMVVVDANVAREAQIRLTALLSTSFSLASDSDSSETKCSYCMVFVGSPGEVHDRTSLVQCAVVVNALGQTIAALTQSEKTRLDSVVELSLIGQQLAAKHRSSMDYEFDIQRAAITFLRSRNIPFVLTSSGEESLKIVVVLALELYRVATHECLLSNAALTFLLSQLSVYMRCRKPLPDIFAQFGVDSIYSAIWRYARFRTVYEGLDITKEKFIRFLHTCIAVASFSTVSGFYSSVLHSITENVENLTNLIEHIFLALVDHCCLSLTQGEVRSARDINLLSIAALWLHPETGGILALAECHMGPPKAVAKRMKEEAQPLKRPYDSLPSLEWIGECGLVFDALKERASEE
ncbi:unnamed protein product [Phytomonas sp. Hart1]|nr:unnamed protein product [Phytomonas sp. Hart1]|eukprot:CCW70037.1 unnamed protein product [Phytomonas sp. isolate Hart1]